MEEESGCVGRVSRDGGLNMKSMERGSMGGWLKGWSIDEYLIEECLREGWWWLGETREWMEEGSLVEG